MSYFQGEAPDFSSWFPDGYSSSPYKTLIDQQNAIGWDHFLRGKLSAGMIKQSEGWKVLLIRLMATSSYTLWDSRNQSRHGSDAATKAQLLKEQTQRELQCLYLLRDQVLIQDQLIFCPTIQQHLEESVPQQCSWLTHYKKLIVHSVKVAKAQAKLKTHQIQRYFRGHRVLQSKVSQATSCHPPPQRHRPTRLSNFFATGSRSIISYDLFSIYRRFPIGVTNHLGGPQGNHYGSRTSPAPTASAQYTQPGHFS
jgi:hypothetical protein